MRLFKQPGVREMASLSEASISPAAQSNNDEVGYAAGILIKH